MNETRKPRKYDQLIESCRALPPMPTAVAHPCDGPSLSAAIDATRLGLIAPILVGPQARIHGAAKAAGLNLGDIEIVDSPHSVESAVRAVALVREGRAEALMKGSCLLYTSPSPRDGLLSRMPSSA